MKFNMNRRALEKITASLVVILASVFAFGLILLIANAIFEWDIFTPQLEKVLYFLMASVLVITLTATLVNVMLNLSRLASFAQAIARHLIDYDQKTFKS